MFSSLLFGGFSGAFRGLFGAFRKLLGSFRVFSETFKVQFHSPKISQLAAKYCRNGNSQSATARMQDYCLLVVQNNLQINSILADQTQTPSTIDIQNKHIGRNLIQLVKQEKIQHPIDFICSISFVSCTCHNGIAKQGYCLPQARLNCQSCKDGFFLKNVRHQNTPLETSGCQQNQCICAFGHSVSENNCPKNDMNFCSSCDPGYHLETYATTHFLNRKVDIKECKINVCQCNHGQAVDSDDCPEHQQVRCQSCNPDRHLDANFHCQPNQCSCTGGNPDPDNCLKHQAENCKSCHNTGYLKIHETPSFPGVDTYACAQKQCVCPNGSPTVGRHCPPHGENACQSCEKGYRLVANSDKNANTCQPIECHCALGTPADHLTCKGHGEKHCISCNPGYNLNYSKCWENKCACSNGNPDPNWGICHSNQGQICQRCHSGFSLADYSVNIDGQVLTHCGP